MALTTEDVASILETELRSVQGSVGPLSGLRRLSSGANNETWTFDWGDSPLILRRRPFSEEESAAAGAVDELGLALCVEAQVLRLAHDAGVQAPEVVLGFDQHHALGESYVMERLPGEALPLRWLSSPDYAEAREQLAYQCGASLARVHTIDTARLPDAVSRLPLEARCAEIQKTLTDAGHLSPALQLGLNWLIDHAPDPEDMVLLHGDFRTGNILVDAQGLSGVLDWELAHCGYVAADLGYLCTPVWRFGQLDQPVGGFGQYADLLAGYKSVAGWAPEVSAIRYWEIFAALSWGLVCLTMGRLWQSGGDRDVERAAVARRRSEAELDLLLLIEAWSDD